MTSFYLKAPELVFGPSDQIFAKVYIFAKGGHR
jgi:hypothetical protein